MAGTIVADTIQDGAGNSTAMDNAIYGSAKAWVTFNGSTATVTASYNVSSITRNSTGNYTITMTTALTDANYATTAAANFVGGGYAWISVPNTGTTPTTTAFQMLVVDVNAARDETRISVTVFR